MSAWIYLRGHEVKPGRMWKFWLAIHLPVWTYSRVKTQTESGGKGTYVDWHQVKYLLALLQSETAKFHTTPSGWHLIIDILSDFPKHGGRINCGEKSAERGLKAIRWRIFMFKKLLTPVVVLVRILLLSTLCMGKIRLEEIFAKKLGEIIIKNVCSKVIHITAYW